MLSILFSVMAQCPILPMQTLCTRIDSAHTQPYTVVEDTESGDALFLDDFGTYPVKDLILPYKNNV